MSSHHSPQQIKEMRQLEGCLMETVLIGATTGGVQGFSDDETRFRFEGSKGFVDFDKSDGSLRVHQEGREAPFYDSLSIDSCHDLELSWDLAYGLNQELTKAITLRQKQIKDELRNS